MSNKKTHLAERLKDLMSALGYSKQSELAANTGVSPQYVSDLLTGRKEFQQPFLSHLADSGVNVNWLLTGEGPMLREGTEGPEIETVQHWKDQAELWKLHALKMEERAERAEKMTERQQGTIEALTGAVTGKWEEEKAMLNDPGGTEADAPGKKK